MALQVNRRRCFGVQLMVVQIFTADEPEVEALPRQEVMHFLETTDSNACVGYLEHVIDVWEEKGADLQDKLAELYLARARTASKTESGGLCPRCFTRCLLLTR